MQSSTQAAPATAAAPVAQSAPAVATPVQATQAAAASAAQAAPISNQTVAATTPATAQIVEVSRIITTQQHTPAAPAVAQKGFTEAALAASSSPQSAMQAENVAAKSAAPVSEKSRRDNAHISIKGLVSESGKPLTSAFESAAAAKTSVESTQAKSAAEALKGACPPGQCRCSEKAVVKLAFG
jgi:hypothetical protein